MLKGVINPENTKPTDSFYLKTIDNNEKEVCISNNEIIFQVESGQIFI